VEGIVSHLTVIVVKMGDYSKIPIERNRTILTICEGLLASSSSRRRQLLEVYAG
jgi:hypothetical protein